MANSREMAGLVGPVVVAVTTSEALNMRIWAHASPTLVYLNGLLLFAAGLTIVRAHNVWTARWPVLLTLIGWVAMAAGLYRLFAPEAPQAPDSPGTYVGVAVLGLIGLVLSVQAYRPDRASQAG